MIQFPPSSKGNKYAIVFMDYLTKWPEVFPSKNQSSLTIACLLVEHIIPRHGVPVQLLSDRGTAFLSKLMEEVYQLLGLKKVNTTAYHPQTDGLVERFNCTLTDMLSKKVARSGKDWDIQLPYVLFAYRASAQHSTGESPFFLLYGRDPVLPTTEMLEPTQERTNLDVDNYIREISLRMSSAWKTAQAKIKEAQKKQKYQHDKKARDPRVFEGDRVFVYSPAERSGKAYKFAHPFKGPYRVLKLLPNGAELSLVAEPNRPTIRVALNRLRRPKEILDVPGELGTLEESEELAESEEDSSEEVIENLWEQEESVVKSKSVQPAVRRSTRLAAEHRRDAIAKDGDI